MENTKCNKLVGLEVIRLDNKQFTNGKFTGTVTENDGETLTLNDGTKVPCNECKQLVR